MPDQPVEVVEYDLAWPSRFVEQRDKVSAALAGWLAGAVEHIGSTSVPGLPAKPIIDMLAPIHSLRDARDAIGVLEADGWLFWPATSSSGRCVGSASTCHCETHCL